MIAFSWEDIDRKNSKVKGYLYNPNSKTWEYGTFPFPTVIVNRMQLSSKRKSYLKDIYGSRFFNSGTFNKWEMYQLLSSNKRLIPHLPKTVLYDKPQDILVYLKHFRTIYVKPISGHKGINIAKFTAESDYYCVKYRKNSENKIIHLYSDEELLSYAESMFKSNQYIIQQEIDLEIEENHLVDFRIVLLKDQSGHWENAGMVGRKGVEGSIVSNRSSGGKVESGEKLTFIILSIIRGRDVTYYQKMTDLLYKLPRKLINMKTYLNMGLI